jgi:protein TonB
MQLRSYLDLARTAIRENRFEDAAAALSAAHGLITTDDTEIDAVANELNAARSAQQVDDVLEKADARLKSGDLLTPSNDNARYYFELVLSVDSRNTSARQGLNVIASKLVLQARAELDKGDVNAAEDILGDARALDPGNSELDATATAVINARAALAAQQRQAEAERQEAARVEAARVEAARVETARVEAERVEAERLEAERLEAELQAAVEPAAEGPAAMGPPEEGSAEMGPPEEGSAAMGPTVEDKAISVRNSRPAGVSSLNRVKYVAPKYPRAAQRRNLSGWVDIAFTVTFDGSVKDIDVPKSQPDKMFVESAIQAVEKWEFEPVLENGTIIEKRVAVRMLFALE